MGLDWYGVALLLILMVGGALVAQQFGLIPTGSAPGTDINVTVGSGTWDPSWNTTVIQIVSGLNLSAGDSGVWNSSWNTVVEGLIAAENLTDWNGAWNSTVTDIILNHAFSSLNATNLFGTNYYLGNSQLGFVAPYSFIINVTGSTYNAWHGANSTLFMSSTNASQVINFAIGNETYGGTTILRGPTTYTLSNTILYQQGQGASHTTKYWWKLVGDGSAILSQSTAGVSAITVKNGTTVFIENLAINLGSSAGYGIYGSSDGADPVSFDGGGISDVVVQGGSASYGQIRLENFWYMHNRNVHLSSGTAGETPLALVTTMTATSNYGNSKFDQFNIYVTGPNSVGIYMNGSRVGSTDRLLNINTFDSINIFGSSSPTAGVSIESLVYANTFSGLDTESCVTGINISGVNPRQSRKNVFVGGYIQGSTNAIYCGQNSYENEFKDLEIIGNIVEASTYGGNTYEDLNIESGSITNTGYGSFRGKAAVGVYFDNYINGANTTATTAVFAHSLFGAADYIFCYFSTSAITGYTATSDGTNITVTPAGTLPSSWTVYAYTKYRP